MSCIYLRKDIFWYKYRHQGKAYCTSQFGENGEKIRTRKMAQYWQKKRDVERTEKNTPLKLNNIGTAIALQTYLDYCKGHKSPNVFKEDKKRLENFLNYAQTEKIKDLSHEVATDYLNKSYLKKNEGCRSAANHIIVTLRTWGNFMVAEEMLAKNPFKRVKKYKIDEPTRTFFSKVDLTKLFEASAGSNLYPMILTAYYTGLRVTELMHLEWENFDWKNNILQLVNKPNFRTKSRKVRFIPLNLSPHFQKCLKPYIRPSGYCFLANRTHKPYKTKPTKEFNRLLKKAGVNGRKIGWHTLRRTFGSHLAQNGVSLLKIAKWMGHASPEITFRIYIHLVPESNNDRKKLL